MEQARGENTKGNTEGPDPKSRNFGPRTVVFGISSPLHLMARVHALPKWLLPQNRRKTDCQEASGRADDSIAPFGTLLRRVLARAERADASGRRGTGMKPSARITLSAHHKV